MKLSKVADTVQSSVSEIKPFITQKLPNIALQIDYLTARARSAEEYQEWKDEVAEIGEITEVVENEGAEVIRVILSESIATDFGPVLLINLEEPLLNKVYDKYGVYLIGLQTEDTQIIRDQFAESNIRHNIQKDGTVMTEASELNIYISENSLTEDIANRNKPSNDAEEINDLKDAIKDLEMEIAELQKEREAKVQLMADFQNYRKRMEKEKASFGLITNMSLASDVLDVLDDVKRTIEDQEKDLERSQQMFEIIKDKLVATINNIGIDMVDVQIGDRFDSSYMEAIGAVAVESVDDHNRVVSVIQPAYKYHDRDQMLKNAKVIVGKKEVTRGKPGKR